MKVKYSLFFATLLSILTCCGFQAAAQKDYLLGSDSCDDISRGHFFAMAKSLKSRMDEHQDFSAQDAIQLIRIYNSMSLTIIAEDSSHATLVNDYKYEFRRNYYKKFAQKYHHGIGKGFTSYLLDLDIYVGLPMAVRCRDYYSIQDNR